MPITDERIKRFCRDLLEKSGASIGFVDVGSGGNLKKPWSLIPRHLLKTFDFEPTDGQKGERPLCISNRRGAAEFYVAHDPRGSSLHKPLPAFVDRFGFQSMEVKEVVAVDCVSLDDHFAGCYDAIDAMDVNVEGHDHQVLQGAHMLLTTGAVKLLKVEFELAPAYEAQGYFSDIDTYLRARHFALANIQVDHVRPVKVRHLYHDGEPIWGKALYVPGRNVLAERLCGARDASAGAKLACAIALFVAAGLLGHAYDTVEDAASTGMLTPSRAQELKGEIESAFRWAKLEAGLDRAGALVGSAFANVTRGRA